MGLFRRRKAIGSGVTTPVQAAESDVIFSPELIQVLRSFDGSLASYGTIYRELAPVRTVVDFLADSVATTALKLHRRTPTGRPVVRDHPASRLIRSPNPELTSLSWIGGTVRDLAVYAVAYWWKVLIGGEFALVPLPPERVTPLGGNVTTSPSVFRYDRLAGPPAYIARSDMAYLHLYAPQDRRVGSSKLEALRPILSEEIEVSRHRRAFWKNAARREGVITQAVDGMPLLPGPDLERFREDWRGKTSGVDKAGATAILRPGMSWNPDSFSPKESEFTEGRKFILEATARTYNVPVSLLGLTETATFASQKEFHKALYQDTLPMWYQVIESEFNRQVLPWVGEPPDGDLYVEFEVESKLRGSFEEQAAIIAAAVGRPFMTVREVRNLFNLDDRGDPRDDELAIPTNNISLDPPQGEALPAPAPLRALPSPAASASRALSLKEALDRQQRSVLSAIGAGKEFDPERWNRELSDLLAEWSTG